MFSQLIRLENVTRLNSKRKYIVRLEDFRGEDFGLKYINTLRKRKLCLGRLDLLF